MNHELTFKEAVRRRYNIADIWNAEEIADDLYNIGHYVSEPTKHEPEQIDSFITRFLRDEYNPSQLFTMDEIQDYLNFVGCDSVYDQDHYGLIA